MFIFSFEERVRERKKNRAPLKCIKTYQTCSPDLLLFPLLHSIIPFTLQPSLSLSNPLTVFHSLCVFYFQHNEGFRNFSNMLDKNTRLCVSLLNSIWYSILCGFNRTISFFVCLLLSSSFLFFIYYYIYLFEFNLFNKNKKINKIKKNEKYGVNLPFKILSRFYNL